MLLRLPPRRCEINRDTGRFAAGVRQARNRYQARIWLGDRSGGSLNLGLYETPTAARCVIRDVIKNVPTDHWTPLQIWQTARSCAGHFSGDAAETLRALLPKWVTAGFGGHLMAKVKSKDRVYVRGPFSDAEEAHLDALRLWEELHGALRPPSWREEVLAVSKRIQ